MERDSCAEFEEDDDSPLTEPGAPDEDEMVFSSDDVDQEAGNQVTSSPYVVNSPHHNNSQADSTDYRVDSGIHSSIETPVIVFESSTHCSIWYWRSIPSSTPPQYSHQ